MKIIEFLIFIIYYINFVNSYDKTYEEWLEMLEIDKKIHKATEIVKEAFNNDNFYEILEIKRDSSPELISSKIRKLGQKLHPDRNKETNSKKYIALGSISEVLKTEKVRKRYDWIRKSGVFWSDSKELYINHPCSGKFKFWSLLKILIILGAITRIMISILKKWKLERDILAARKQIAGMPKNKLQKLEQRVQASRKQNKKLDECPKDVQDYILASSHPTPIDWKKVIFPWKNIFKKIHKE